MTITITLLCAFMYISCGHAAWIVLEASWLKIFGDLEHIPMGVLWGCALLGPLGMLFALLIYTMDRARRRDRA